MLSTVILTILALFLRKPQGRFCFYFLGALLVLGPEQITYQKIFYFTLVLISAFASIFNLQKMRIVKSNPDLIKNALGIFRWLTILVIYLFITSISQGVSFTSTARILYPLLLSLVGIPLTLDVGVSIKKEMLLRLTIFFGMVASVLVFITWTQKRGIYDFYVGRIGLDSEWMALLSLIIIIVIKEKILRFYAFDVIAVILIVTFLTSSLTRSNIIIISFIVLTAFCLGKSKLKIFGVIAICFFGLGALIQSGLIVSIFGNEYFYRIVRSFSLFRNDGFSAQGLGGDGSFQLREQQSEQAFQIWKEHLFLGSGMLPTNFTLDTIIATPAQLGIIGMSIFLIFSYKFVMTYFKFSALGSLRKVGTVYFLSLFFSSLIYNWPLNKSVWMSSSLLMILSINYAFNNSLEVRTLSASDRK